MDWEFQSISIEGIGLDLEEAIREQRQRLLG